VAITTLMLFVLAIGLSGQVLAKSSLVGQSLTSTTTCSKGEALNEIPKSDIVKATVEDEIFDQSISLWQRGAVRMRAGDQRQGSSEVGNATHRAHARTTDVAEESNNMWAWWKNRNTTYRKGNHSLKKFHWAYGDHSFVNDGRLQLSNTRMNKLYLGIREDFVQAKILQREKCIAPMGAENLCPHIDHVIGCVLKGTEGANATEQAELVRSTLAPGYWLWFPGPRGGFMNIDKNKNDHIDKSEWNGVCKSTQFCNCIFNLIDDDHDSKLKRAEVGKYLHVILATAAYVPRVIPDWTGLKPLFAVKNFNSTKAFLYSRILMEFQDETQTHMWLFFTVICPVAAIFIVTMCYLHTKS